MKKRSQHTRRRLRGGKYISEGAYGCTFASPPLKCKSNATRRNANQLSKMMNLHNATEELAKSNLFRAIDPKETYFITANHKCDLNIGNIKPSNQMDKCKLKNADKATRLLFYNFGGNDLGKIKLLQPELYGPIFKSFVNLFDGLQLAHDNHLIHHDIKSTNIVTGPSSDGISLHTRFIDFGFAQKFPITDEYDKKVLDDQIKDTYIVWPFDTRYLNAEVNYDAHDPSYTANFEKQFQEWHEEYKNRYPDYLPFFFDANENPKTKYATYFSRVIQPFLDNPIGNQESIMMAADRYALGLIFIKLLYYLYYSIEYTGPNMVNFAIWSSKLPGGMGFTVQLEQYGIPGPIADWHRDVSKHIGQPIFEIISGLCNYNPLSRISIADAKQIYTTKVIPNLDRLFEPALVYEGLRAVKNIPGFQLQPVSPTVPQPPAGSTGPSSSPKQTSRPPLPKSRRSRH